jgi:hypothetical protein
MPTLPGRSGGSEAREVTARLLCPHCGSSSNRRINSRRFKARRLADMNVVGRAHICCACGKEWASIETPTLGKMAEAVLAVLER